MNPALEGLESREDITLTITATAATIPMEMKDRRRSMQSPAGNTMENILGESARSTGRVTTTKETVGEITIEGTTREALTQAGNLHQVPTSSALMNVAS